MMINPPRESMSVKDKETLQTKLFTREMKWVAAKSPYYKEVLLKTFGKAEAELLQEPENWAKLPVTEELPEDTYQLLTGPLSNTMRFTKNAEDRYFGVSQGDLTGNLDMVIRALAANNINKTSLAVICGDYTKQGILDLHYGAEALGATVFPCNNTEELGDIYQKFHPDTILGDEVVAEYCLAEGIETQRFVLISSEVPETLTASTGFIYCDELTGSVAWAFTCEEGELHLQDDYLKVDLEQGKVLFTPLTLEAMPLLKVSSNLKAGALTGEICACGRTLMRIK